MTNEMKHYGILGMKWGVRRTPEQLGHVKKGTKMYRVTPNPDEKEEGSTYVTYLAPDRDMYRGMFAKTGGFQRQYSLDNDSPLYEAVYKNKEDLKVATYDVTKEVTTEVLKRDKDKLFKELCKHAAETNIEQYNEIIEKARELRKTNPDIPGDDFYQYYYLQNCKSGKEYVKKVFNDFKAMSPDDLYQVVSSRFGVENTVKEAVITELRKKGYNAMIDQASVGGTRRDIEGQAPMIIFNRDEVLEKLGAKKISKLTMELANERYWEWNNMVNSNSKKVADWAYEKRKDPS